MNSVSVTFCKLQLCIPEQGEEGGKNEDLNDDKVT